MESNQKFNMCCLKKTILFSLVNLYFLLENRWIPVLKLHLQKYFVSKLLQKLSVEGERELELTDFKAQIEVLSLKKAKNQQKTKQSEKSFL